MDNEKILKILAEIQKSAGYKAFKKKFAGLYFEMEDDSEPTHEWPKVDHLNYSFVLASAYLDAAQKTLSHLQSNLAHISQSLKEIRN